MTGNTISLRVDTASGNAQVMVYDSDGAAGAPQTLLCNSASTSLGSSAGVVNFTLSGCPSKWTAGHAYWLFYQLDNGTAAVDNPYRGEPGVIRYFEAGTTYGSPPTTLSGIGNQTAFGYYGIWLNVTPTVASTIVSAGWPAVMDQITGGNVANIVGYQKMVPSVSGNVTVLEGNYPPWAGSAPNVNLAVYDSDGGAIGDPETGTDGFPKTLICQATPITLSIAVGPTTFTPTGLCPVTAGHLYWIANNLSTSNTVGGQCTGTFGSPGNDCYSPTLGTTGGLTPYYVFTDNSTTYTCCTYATLTGTQISNLGVNGADWLLVAAYITPNAAKGHHVSVTNSQ